MKLLETTLHQIEDQDRGVRAAAHARLEQLTMPYWALGRLMDLAEDLAGITRSLRPPLARKKVVTMAGDHGIVASGVSKYPQEVTPQMVFNIVAGGAGINALARAAGAEVVLADLGVAADLSALAAKGAIVSKRVGPGTRNFAVEPAMSRDEAVRSVEAGIEIAQDLGPTTDVFATGDLGIGNTTPSAAIVATLTGCPVEDVTGRGTGLDDEQLRRKIDVLKQALALHRPNPQDGLDVLAKVGGFELGGIAGLILGSAAQRKPVIVDGFISNAGALLAQALAPRSVQYMIASHGSVEPGHRAALDKLGKQALVDLNLRLGEGTGAALVMPMLDAAARLLTDVATFAEAAVSTANG
jgi:nicotinate-nucleotide--dimethylbenzimidazole phosphoribosyltransferase